MDRKYYFQLSPNIYNPFSTIQLLLTTDRLKWIAEWLLIFWIMCNLGTSRGILQNTEHKCRTPNDCVFRDNS